MAEKNKKMCRAILSFLRNYFPYIMQAFAILGFLVDFSPNMAEIKNSFETFLT